MAMFPRPQGGQEAILVALVVIGFILGVGAAVVVGVLLSAKRHVTFYRDLTKAERLMDILQDSKFQPINSTYTVRDREGNVLTFHKNILYNLIRKRHGTATPRTRR